MTLGVQLPINSDLRESGETTTSFCIQTVQGKHAVCTLAALVTSLNQHDAAEGCLEIGIACFCFIFRMQGGAT